MSAEIKARSGGDSKPHQEESKYRSSSPATHSALRHLQAQIAELTTAVHTLANSPASPGSPKRILGSRNNNASAIKGDRKGDGLAGSGSVEDNSLGSPLRHPPAKLSFAKELEQMRSENVALKVENEVLARGLKEAEKARDELRHQRDSLQAELTTMQEDHHTLKGRLVQLEADYQGLLRQIESGLNPLQETAPNSLSASVTSRTPEEFLQLLLTSPQVTPRHQPYLTPQATSADGAATSAMPSFSLDGGSAYPVAPPLIHIPEGVVGEVVEFHNGDGASTPTQANQEVLDRLKSIQGMAHQLARVQAYSTTALFLSLGPRLRLSRSEDLYTLWRAFGGQEGFARCRSRINALLDLLENCTISRLNVVPSRMYVGSYSLILDEDEVSVFVGVMLSRLPKLKTLTFTGYASWPMPSTSQRHERVPFPALCKLEILNTPWTEQQVKGLLEGLRAQKQQCLYSLCVTKALAPAGCDTEALRKDVNRLLRYK